MSVILCLFSALSRRVGALQISIIIIIIIVRQMKGLTCPNGSSLLIPRVVLKWTPPGKEADHGAVKTTRNFLLVKCLFWNGLIPKQPTDSITCITIHPVPVLSVFLLQLSLVFDVFDKIEQIREMYSPNTTKNKDRFRPKNKSFSGARR